MTREHPLKGSGRVTTAEVRHPAIRRLLERFASPI
jgi:hypothetical protein